MLPGQANRLGEYFAYLDDLRKTGATNMFGAAPYLAHAHSMPLTEARSILGMWMGIPIDSGSPDERARAALAKAGAA